MSTRRTLRATAPALLAVAGVVAPGVAALGTHAAAAAPVFNVATYGAVGDGAHESTDAFAAAIAAAQAAGGGEVYVPAGTYEFDKPSPGGPYGASVRLHGTVPVSLVGAGAGTTALVQHNPAQPLISMQADGSSVIGLTLDTAAYRGGTVVGVQANNTLLQGDVIHGSDQAFALYYRGPAAASRTSVAYNTGNRVLDDVVTDDISNDGFSFSFQRNATISNITYTGSRLAIYLDSYVTVNGFSYTPGPQQSAKDGFYVTSPSDHITINGFTSSGSGGIVGGPVDKNWSSAISIGQERLTAPGGHLQIGNARGVSVTGSTFPAGDAIVVNGPSGANLTVSGSTVAAVRFSGPSTASVVATFVNDTFPTTLLNGRPFPAFRCNTSPQLSLTVSSGRVSGPGGLTDKTMAPSGSALTCAG